MTETEELAQKLLLLSALEKRITELRTETKAGLRRLIGPGTTIKLPVSEEDQRPVGRVSFTVNRTTASVSDEDAWAAWVEKHYPNGVDLVLTVKDWVTAQAIRMSQEAGVPVGPGGECGEDGPPGITVREAGGYISAYPNPERMPQLWQAIRERLPELTANPDEEGLAHG